jgi:hypothetical protein
MEAKTKIAELKKMMRAEDRLADLNEQLRTGEFRVKEKPVSVELPVEIQRIKVDIKRKNYQIRELQEAITPKTVFGKILEAGNLVRTAQTIGEISPALRQGLVPLVSLIRQGEWGKITQAHGEALKALFSEFSAEQIDIWIREHPHNYIYDRAKLHITELGAQLSRREEFFQSSIAEKVPAYKHIVKASHRYMTTLLNLLRVNMFETMLERYPNATRAELTAWADYVNKASGRGDLKSFEQSAGALATIFFAPKFAVSRFQTPLAVWKSRKTPRVQMEIAKDMASAVSMGVTALTLAKLAGATVNTDYRDPDFGKIRVGDTRVDIFAGFQQPARLLIRSVVVGTDAWGISGQDLPQSEKDVKLQELWGRFAGWKLSPAITISAELASREDVFGNPTTPQGTILRAVVPIITSSTLNAYKKDGLGAAGLTFGSEFVGFGSSTYKDAEGRVRKNIRKLWKEGKEDEAKETTENWNLLNPDNRIVGMDIIDGADTTRIELAKPKEKANKKFIYKRVTP